MSKEINLNCETTSSASDIEPVMREEQDVEAAQVTSITDREQLQKVKSIIDVPDGGYGWFVVVGVFLFNISTWASNSGFSIYLAHYLEYNKFAGATKLDYGAIGGIAFGGGLLFTPFILYVKEKTSTRTVIIIGGVLQFLGIFLAAFSTKLWEIYMSQGVLIGFGLACITSTANSLIPQWFREKRSLAQSLTASGSGFGGIMFNLAMQAIIKNISLKWALIIQSIICSVCTFIGVLLIRTRDTHIKATFKIWDAEIFISLGFLLLALFVIFTVLGYVILLYNLADFTKSLGYSASQGSVVSCMVSVGASFGRPIFGKLCDRFGAVTVNLFAHLLVAIFCFAIWIPARNYSTAIGFAIVQGSLMGSIWVSQAPILTRLFGLRRLGSILGLFYSIIGTFGIASPIIGIKLRGEAPAGKLYDPTQYRNPAIFCGFCYFGSVLALWCLRGYLIARDQVAESQNSHEDNDELHIKITFKDVLFKLFSLSKTRKV